MAASDIDVTVVIPAYNAAGVVATAVRSALDQTLASIDVIVVDDGSRDATAAVAEAAGEGDPRLKVVRQENGGVSAARNRGAREGHGRAIAILDADDLWHPQKLERQLAVMDRNGSRTGLVYCRFREVDEAGRVLRSPILDTHTGDVYAPLVLFNFIGGGSGALIRREAFDAVGGCDTTQREGAEDIMLFLSVAERYDVDLADAFLLGYRRSLGTMSGETDKMLRATAVVLERARRSHPELPARLFRWGRGETLAWLATEALYEGRLATGLSTLARAALLDPGATFTRRTGHAFSIAARRLARGTVGARAAAPPVRPEAPATLPGGERHFLSYAPEEGLSPARAVPDRMARRCAVASRWHVHRTAGGSGTQ